MSKFYPLKSTAVLVLVLFTSMVFARDPVLPSITSFSPASGPIGTLITITGTDLSNSTAVTIGGTTAIVISNTGTSLVAMVMPGTSEGAISLTTTGGTATSIGSFTVTASATPNSQQGSKLAGNGTGSIPRRGASVAISADGNIAIVGEKTGAWIYSRSGTTWTKQEAQLAGNDVSGSILSAAVSISADGNTAMVGGYYDGAGKGAVWFFTRNNNEWTQQGDKIVVASSKEFGWSVALSADGNTAISGDDADSGAKGAVYIFKRSSSGTWSPQSGKLVGTGSVSGGQFGAKMGASVALSADGNTAIVGGPNDAKKGAVWIFTRTGDDWAQQGDKIVGRDYSGNPEFGSAVSLSADGNTALIGGGKDNGVGAAWVFTRTGDTWTQQGDKLIGTGAIGNSSQGNAVSLSADGNTAIVGGPMDNVSPTYKTHGAAWIYSRDAEGGWTQKGDKLVDAEGSAEAQFGAAVSLSADGNTAVIGGPADNGQKGSVWFFAAIPPPTITSAAYDASTGTLVVTGTDFVAVEGENNDIIASKFTITGSDGTTYTLTDSANPEITSETSFTITLSSTDIAAVNSILNKNGNASADETTYNLAGAEGWSAGASAEDLSENGILVSGVFPTKVTSELCGTTLTEKHGEVYANPVDGATAYRFRVKAGENEQILDAESEVIWLSDLTFFAYSTTYTINVAVEVDGEWSEYGTACQVTMPAPSTQIEVSLRGATLENMNSEIYAEDVPLATAYRFRVKEGDNEQVLETESGVFRMVHLSTYAYNTTYTIDVAVKTGENWSEYGTAYEISTPAQPLTQIAAEFCGTTLGNNLEIYADDAPLATAYRFRVKLGDDQQVIDAETASFLLNDVNFFAYSTTYSIDVAVEVGGEWSNYGAACDVTTAAPMTQLGGFLCGETLGNDLEIYADNVPLATAYRFRVKSGDDQQVIDAETASFQLNDVNFFAYSTTYSIDVAVEVGGEWSEYGTSCEVTTAAPMTQLGGFLCGATLDVNDLEIYADNVSLATAYRFRVKSGDDEQVIEAETASFQLNDVNFFAYSTTYTIDVAVKTGETWSEYGTACQVMMPAPSTQIEASLRGATLENMDAEIYADNVPLATAYRFRVKEGDNEQVLETESGVFRMAHLSTFAYNTTYTIDVAVKIGENWSDYGTAYEISTPAQPLTQIGSEFCGTTLGNNMEIYADQPALATAYRFRVKAGENEQVIDAESEYFRLSDLTFFAYNTTYTIDVAVEVGGEWSEYGPSCEVTTPAPSTQIEASLRGATLENMDAEIYADNVPLATAYRFRVKEGDNEQVLETESGVFRMVHLSTFAYNTTYTIDVAVKIGENWSDYGTAYEISTPAQPLTQIAAEFCGTTLGNNMEIYADQPALATAYRFRVKAGENEQVIDAESEYFRLSDLTFFAYNTTYTIDVAVEVGGVWGDYGAACVITTPTGIINVSSDNPDGNYGTGAVLGITVNFSGAVHVTGTPTLALNSGGTAVYNSGDGSSTLLFNYTVAADEQAADLDYNDNLLDLSDATLRDANDKEVALNLPDPGSAGSLGANKNLVIDAIIPAMNSVVILSNNNDTALAKPGDIITVNFTSSEPVAGPVVTISGHLADTEHVANNDWTATYVMTGADTEGTILFSIAFKDAAGNTGISVTETTNSSSVTFDHTAPAGPLNFVTTAGNTQIVLNWTANEEPDLKAYNVYGGTSANPATLLQTVASGITTYTHTGLTNGTEYYYRITATDITGNESSFSAENNAIPRANQTILFEALAAKTYGDADFSPGATSETSGINEITYTSSNTAVATIVEGLIHIVGAGTTDVTASQNGSEYYNRASDIVQSLTVNKASLTVTADNKQKLQGEANPELTLTYQGLIMGDDTSVFATIPVASTIADINSPAADYPISISEGAADNYIFTYAEGMLTINPAINASLASLTISGGTLSPSFDPAVLSYTGSVANTETTFTVNPTASNSGATVKVNGTAVASGSVSGSIALAVGSNIITIEVTAQDGVTGKTYTVQIIRLRPGQTLPDQSGEASLNNTVTQVVVISPTQPVLVTVPDGTASPSVDYSSLITGGTGTIPQTTVNSSFAQMEIPASTKVTASGPGWDGVLSVPGITTYELPAIPGQIITTGLIIEVGSPGYSLSFDKAVRLVLSGQAGMRVGRVHDNVYTEILLTGTADNQAAGDALPADGTFKMNSAADMVIWTKVFSKFITFSQTTDLNVALVQADKSELTADAIKGSNTDISAITGPLQLPATGSFGSAITWVSSNPGIISADGKVIARPLFGSGNTTVIITATITKGLITESTTFTLIVPELPNQTPTMSTVADQAICYDTSDHSIRLTGITPGPETAQTLTLAVTSNRADLFNRLTVTDAGILTYSIKPGQSGTALVTVTVKDNGGTANGGVDQATRSFTIHVDPLPVVAISSSKGSGNLSKGDIAVLTATGGTSYSWSDAAGIISGQNTASLTVQPLQNATYTVTAVNASGCATTQSFAVMVMEDYKTVKSTNLMSPNGDGVNDLWVVKNIELYPDNEVKVFDRAGRTLFSKKGYDNTWDATVRGVPLAEGTYYYVIDFGENKLKVKGFITIVRD